MKDENQLEPSLNTLSLPGMAIPALQARMRADGDLSSSRRRDLISSLNCLAKGLRRSPEDIVLTPGTIERLLDAVVASYLVRGQAKRAVNLRSDLLSVVDRYVRPTLMAPGEYPLTPLWAALYELAGELQDKYAVKRLMHFSSYHSIEPDDFGQSAFSEYCKWVSEISIRKSPARQNQLTRNAWNRFARHLQGWPRTVLENPRASTSYVLGLDQFAPDFLKDLDAWLKHLGSVGENAFDDTCPSKALKDESLGSRRFSILQIASAIVHEGYPIDKLNCLADLLDEDLIISVICFMEKRLGLHHKQPSYQIAQLMSVLAKIAKHWVKAGPRMLHGLKTLQGDYRPNPHRLSSKNRTRLQQFKDPQNLRALVNLPWDIAHLVASGKRTSKQALYALEAALLIEIELMFPIRLKNVANLKIGKHILDTGKGAERRLVITVPEHEVKNGRPLLAELPPQSIELYDLYCEVARPKLCQLPSDYLFPCEKNRKGRVSEAKVGSDKARNKSTLSRRVTRTVKAMLGLDVNLHGFRHISALIFLTAHPGHHDEMARILGHADTKSLTRYYEDLQCQPSLDRLHQEVLRLRKANLQPKKKG